VSILLLLNRTELKLYESYCLSVGIFRPENDAIVRNKSITVAGCPVTELGLIFDGHQAIAGSLTPPSNVVCFPQRSGPLLPASNLLTFKMKAFIEI